MAKILDCTLRDGGYYTKWDFDFKIVDSYIKAMNLLPVDYLEVGYRNVPCQEYLGEYGYSPVSVLRHLRETCTKKLVVMLNEKSTRIEDLDALVKPMVGLIDMVRIAIDPKNFERAVGLAKTISTLGFEVGFNCMYMSKWSSDYPNFLKKLGALNDFCDLFCMVDSFGGVTPKDIIKIYDEVRENTTVPIGFHGHNNLQLGLINTVTAMNLGVDYVDATILGMGRGAGNLNMELLLTYLNSHNGILVDFNVLGDVISAFTPLMEKYQWGTNLPYMLAGANNIPQKEVMDWVTNRVYSFNSIVRALDNRKQRVVDNAKYDILRERIKAKVAIVVGGGDSVCKHINGIKEFINSQRDIILIFATARNASAFVDVDKKKYYCLVGNEGRRLTDNVGPENFVGTCILPPYPRTMGTEVPFFAEQYTLELPSIEFTTKYKDSVTTIALQTAINLADDIYLIGYDGYPGSVLSEKEMSLTNENKTIFEDFSIATGRSLKSLTPSLYKNIIIESVYQFI